MTSNDQPLVLRIAVKEARPNAQVDLGEPTMLTHTERLFGNFDLEQLTLAPQEFIVELAPVYPERRYRRWTTKLTIQLSAANQ
jgi:hypothetical protein